MKLKHLSWFSAPISMFMLWCICRVLGVPMPTDLEVDPGE